MGAGASAERQAAQVAEASPAELRELAATLSFPEREKFKEALALVAGDGSLKLEVLLPSGHCEAVSMPPGSTVSDLGAAARSALGLQGRLRLVASDGQLLDRGQQLSSGDRITAIAQQLDSTNCPP